MAEESHPNLHIYSADLCELKSQPVSLEHLDN